MFKEIIEAIWNFVKGTRSPEAVAAALDKRAAARSGDKLNWRNSIVDLLKLIDKDSSLDARKKMAHDAGYVGDFTGTAQDNVWLHEKVMEAIGQNNIKVP